MSLRKQGLIFLLALITCNISPVICQTSEETDSYSNYNIVKLIGNAVKHASLSKDLQSILKDSMAPLSDFLIKYLKPGLFINALIQPASNKCSADLDYLFHNISAEWKIKMFDSFGKPEKGILSGNLKWIGEYDECLGVYAPPQFNENFNTSVGDFHGRYCSLQFPLTFKNITLPIVMGACLPDSCNPNGYLSNASIANIADQIPIYGEKIATLLNSTKITCQDTQRSLSGGAIAVIFLLSIFIFLATTGSSITAFKYYMQRNTEGKNGIINTSAEPIAIDLIEKSSQNGSSEALTTMRASQKTWPAWYGKCDTFFNCFCVFTNGEKIFNTSNTEGQMLCLHGIRFLSMSWVMFGHTYSFCVNSIRNAVETLHLIDHFLYQIIMNGAYSVDSFFLLSGFLVAYLFFQQSAKNKGGIPWLYFYVHRYLRLTPVYMIVLAFYTTLLGYLGSGPVWNRLNTDPYCHSNWWWNLLYINNFLYLNDQCMGWTWYLANDMQFYIISPLFLVTLWKWPKIGYSVLALFFSITFTVNFVLTYKYDIITGIGDIFMMNQDVALYLFKWGEKFDKIYVKPYARIGPYLVGIALAYYLFKRKQNNAGNLRLITLCFGWIVASAVTLTCVFGLYHHNPNTVAASFYNALSSICFACGVAWVIFVCLIGQGGFVNRLLSWKLWIPLSRLTFCAYLVHPMIQHLYYDSLKSLLHFSHIIMVIHCLGFLILSYMAALVTTLLFESPIIRLERLIRNGFTP